MLVDAASLLVGAGVGKATGTLLRAMGSKIVPKAADTAAKSITTVYATERQSASMAARSALTEARSGATVYRTGNLGDSMTGESQYWSLQNPTTKSNFAGGLGLPLVGSDSRFIMGGTLKSSASAITNKAAGLGVNAGGEIQLVTEPSGVGGLWFHMPE